MFKRKKAKLQFQFHKLVKCFKSPQIAKANKGMDDTSKGRDRESETYFDKCRYGKDKTSA